MFKSHRAIDDPSIVGVGYKEDVEYRSLEFPAAAEACAADRGVAGAVGLKLADDVVVVVT